MFHTDGMTAQADEILEAAVVPTPHPTAYFVLCQNHSLRWT